MTAHALLTDTHKLSGEVWSALRPGSGLSSPALTWSDPGPSEVHGFCGTISPALCKEGSKMWCLPQLWVPGCVCDDVGISSLFLLWPLLCQCIGITWSHPPQITEFPSRKVCITGLYNSLLSFLLCGSWNSVQSCFSPSFDNTSYM